MRSQRPRPQVRIPAELAKAWAAGFVPNDLIASATATGPFVNLRANRPADGYNWLIGAALEGTLVPRAIGAGQTIVIDCSSPNTGLPTTTSGRR